MSPPASPQEIQPPRRRAPLSSLQGASGAECAQPANFRSPSGKSTSAGVAYSSGIFRLEHERPVDAMRVVSSGGTRDSGAGSNSKCDGGLVGEGPLVSYGVGGVCGGRDARRLVTIAPEDHAVSGLALGGAAGAHELAVRRVSTAWSSGSGSSSNGGVSGGGSKRESSQGGGIVGDENAASQSTGSANASSTGVSSVSSGSAVDAPARRVRTRSSGGGGDCAGGGSKRDKSVSSQLSSCSGGAAINSAENSSNSTLGRVDKAARRVSTWSSSSGRESSGRCERVARRSSGAKEWTDACDGCRERRERQSTEGGEDEGLCEDCAAEAEEMARGTGMRREAKRARRSTSVVCTAVLWVRSVALTSVQF